MPNNLYNQLNSSQSNPPQKANINTIMQEVQQSGMCARDLFFTKVRQMGIDPQSILSQIPNQYK